jgi:hypothetical protein
VGIETDSFRQSNSGGMSSARVLPICGLALVRPSNQATFVGGATAAGATVRVRHAQRLITGLRMRPGVVQG